MNENDQARVQPLWELNGFLDALASAEAVPGGGSSAALCGAIGAGLVAMVCRVTTKSDLAQIAHHADALRQELVALVELDGEAYRRVIEAHQLPKDNSARETTIQEALIHATEVPMRTANLCSKVLALAASTASRANRRTVSDLYVGALIAQAGLRGAVVTAETNLSEIRDDVFVQIERAHIAEMNEAAEKNLKKISVGSSRPEEHP